MNKFILLIGSNKHPDINIEKAKKLLGNICDEIKYSETEKSKAIVSAAKSDYLYANNASPASIPDYTNLVAIGETNFGYEDFNKKLKEVEKKTGRNKNARIEVFVEIDIDIVEWNGEVVRPHDASQEYYRNPLKKFLSKESGK